MAVKTKKVDVSLMEVEYWNTDKVIPYERNPRKNDAAVGAVAESIRQFGFVNPILIDKEGVVIAGHTRLKAAQELNLGRVPVIVNKDLTEEQVRAYRIIDNSSAQIAGWDVELLEIEISDLPDFDFETFGLGVEVPELFEHDIDGFFTEHKDPVKDNPAQTHVTCPKCGEVFEI